ncbi:MAG: DNA polymerase III subunit delta [Gammaproteobacteria bacterium]|nr:DNA polymerase III subunit delta [Gammaproteobacteria bacterium]
MRISPGQLERHLQQGLKPVYLLCGDEPLQLIEAADLIREFAKQDGYTERDVVFVEPGFDWRELEQISGNLSLFSERRIIDLRLASVTPGNDGSKALQSYAGHPPRDTLLLLQMGKLERNALTSAWFRALDQAGIVIQVWPLNNRQVRDWVSKRLRLAGMQADDDAVRLLVARVEGNLLAARQEIDKLSLLFGQSRLDAKSIYEAVVDSARFNVFDLADAALEGDTIRSVKVLNGLHAEDVGTPLVLWSLTEQVRSLVAMSFDLERGATLSQVTQKQWQRRKPLIAKALRRHSHCVWCRLLRRCAQVDRVIKGVDNQDREWEKLLQLVLQMCGQHVLSTTSDIS